MSKGFLVKCRPCGDESYQKLTLENKSGDVIECQRCFSNICSVKTCEKCPRKFFSKPGRNDTKCNICIKKKNCVDCGKSIISTGYECDECVEKSTVLYKYSNSEIEDPPDGYFEEDLYLVSNYDYDDESVDGYESDPTEIRKYNIRKTIVQRVPLGIIDTEEEKEKLELLSKHMSPFTFNCCIRIESTSITLINSEEVPDSVEDKFLTYRMGGGFGVEYEETYYER
jgi:hypothetical protein